MTRFLSLLLTLLFCFVAHSLLATHNRGGTIQYTHISGNTYEATIITYTKVSPPSNQADRAELTINWGDNSTPEVLLRTSFSLVAPDVQQNIYTGTHTYSNAGTYTVFMQDPNRNDGILNINGGNSVGIPFYLEAQLIVSSAENNSVRYLAPPITHAEIGQTFSYNLTAYDPDGDILLYDLVTPKQAAGLAVPNYQELTDIGPSTNNTTNLNALNGLFSWDAPQIAGEYSLAIRVREYRNCVLVGTTIMDYQLVVAAAAASPQWTGTSTWSVDSVGNYSYTIAPNTPLLLGLSFSDNNANVDLEIYSETISSGTATVANNALSPNQDSLTYQWTPTAADARCAPYLVTFRGQANYPMRLDRDISVEIYVRDNSTLTCATLFTTGCFTPIRQLPNQPTASVALSPNPFQQTCLFEIDTNDP